jgi:hypothetical protein
VAHARDESVAVEEIFVAAKAIAACVLDWCGVAGTEKEE